ncbi:MAG: nucleotide sugar dehydrogenase [Acidimicrobiia bacterium]|nr:nucleotide sugar dehydrogenase [Acidimicrobiia bacterium]
MSELEQRIESGDWTIGVIGLGYVGLPLAVAATKAGIGAIGYDIDVEYVDRLRRGFSSIEDVTDEDLQAASTAGFRLTHDAADLSDADMLVVCVPSPLGAHREPDMSYIRSAADTVTKVITPQTLVSLESTTYPGTTHDIMIPAVTAAGLELDHDVWVAFSPERVSPGDVMKTADIPKVVGGVTPDSTRIAAKAYDQLVSSVHPVSDAAIAEMAKLLENTYRAVNIALANEMAQMAHELDVDIWEVIDAAATKPFGFQAFYPGPGVGGHCIPLDPQFLAWRAREKRFAPRFIDLAEQVNLHMPTYTANRIGEALNDRGLSVRGARILGLGIAYKPNIADDRESASIEVLRILDGRGAHLEVLDPVVGDEGVTAAGFVPATPGSRYDVAVVLTDHDVLDLADIAKQADLVFDARAAYRKRAIDADNVVVM